MLVSINLLVASVAEEDAAWGAGHLIAALAALYGHATSWTLLAVFLHRQKIGLCAQPKRTNVKLDLDSMLIVLWLDKLVEGTLNKTQCVKTSHTLYGQVDNWSVSIVCTGHFL